MAGTGIALQNLMDSVYGFANTAAKVTDDYVTNQAELSTQFKTSQLQSEINGQLARIKQDTNYENWNTEINDFFERVKNGMSDKDSPYYCKNNLQAQMFTKVLEQNLVSVSDHVNSMVIQEQQAEARVNINNGILNYKNMGLAGQELYDKSKELVDGGRAIKAYSAEEYSNMLDQIFYDSYGTMYEQMFDKTWKEAIDRGDSWDTVKNMMIEQAPQMMKTDGNNMPVAFDKEAYDTRIFQNLERKFNAKQQDVWNQTEKKCSQLFDNVMDGTTAEERNKARLLGRQYLDTIKNTGRISPEQLTKWTNYFKLEDYKSGGSTTASQAKAAINQLKPEDAMKFFLNSIKRGDESDLGGPATVYDSYDLFKEKCMNELTKLNPDYSYTDLEQACPSVMEYLEYAKKNLPPTFQDVVSSAENMLKLAVNTKDNKEAYKDELNGVMDIVYDILFETNISDFDAKAQEQVKQRVARMINSKYGSVLQKQKDYKWLKDETGIEAITNYKQGVFGQEKTLAKAMQARDSNQDIYYEDMYGNKKFFMGEDVQKGLTLIENEEKKLIAESIKYKTGKEINPDEIPSSYQSDGTHDVNARKVYTVNGMDYYFTSKDGKHVTMYEKKTGESEFHESMTEKENKKYDVDTGIEAWKKGDKNARPPITILNTNAAGGGEMTATEWAMASDSFKTNIIKRWLKEEPQVALNWISKHSK